MDTPSPMVITGELAGLLKVGVLFVYKVLWSRSYNSQVNAINIYLNEGTKFLEGLWEQIPPECKENLIKKFQQCAVCSWSLWEPF